MLAIALREELQECEMMKNREAFEVSFPAKSPMIRDGRCHALFSYDLGMSVDLDQCDRLITAVKHREALRHKRRAPTYFEYRPLPLRIEQGGQTFDIGGFRTLATVDVVLYDFGAVSVIYNLSLNGPLSGLLALSHELYDNEFLLADSRGRVQELLGTIQQAVKQASIADEVEDYVIYEIHEFDEPFPDMNLTGELRQTIAQILRSEHTVLSDQEACDATACRLCFEPDDITIIDWNAAFVIDRDAEDIITVLEFANVELLEMRHLDRQLDNALNQAYVMLPRRKRSWRRLALGFGTDLDRLAQLQVDSALLFEGVNNSLKLVGDQYLARVYMLASQRFHLAEWDASILRKIETLNSIYDKLSSRATSLRMEVLEWVIIILIALEVVRAFMPGK